MLKWCWQIHFCVMDAEGLNYFYIPKKVIRANELTKSSSTEICVDLRSSLQQTYCRSHLQPFPLPPFCDTSSTSCFLILMLSYLNTFQLFSFSLLPPFVCWLSAAWPLSQARGALASHQRFLLRFQWGGWAERRILPYSASLFPYCHSLWEICILDAPPELFSWNGSCWRSSSRTAGWQDHIRPAA